MFGKREFRVRVAKIDDNKNAETETPKPYQDPEVMNAIMKDFVKSTAVVVTVAFVAAFTWKAGLEIIIRCVPDK